MNENDTRELEHLLHTYGVDLIRTKISELSTKEYSDICTIISDDTVHHIPERLIVGENYVFSTGNIDITDSITIRNHLEASTEKLITFLKTREWSRIRLLYAGHSILPALIKYIVYRVTHKETEDIIYFGGTGYHEVKLELRDLV